MINAAEGCKSNPQNAHSPLRGHVPVKNRPLFIHRYEQESRALARRDQPAPRSQLPARGSRAPLKVTHFFIGLGQIELGINLFPLCIIGRGRCNRCRSGFCGSTLGWLSRQIKIDRPDIKLWGGRLPEEHRVRQLDVKLDGILIGSVASVREGF